MWCKKRMTCEALMVRFGDAKHRFYLESVCGMPTTKDSPLCRYCIELQSQTKTQDVGTFPHGLVDTIYTKESHIYDSPWYHLKVKAYGQPSDESIELAMEAQKKARAGKRIIKKQDLCISIHDISSVVKPAVKPVALKEKKVTKELVEKSKATASSKSSGQSRQSKSSNVSKTVSETNTLPVREDLQASVLMQLGAVHESVVVSIDEGVYIESMDMPLEVKEVVKSVLKQIEHKGRTFWLSSHQQTLYAKQHDGSIGEYIGQWNPKNETILYDVHDSDLEE
jgi:hypothetical protein